jgi:hypothetical protein
MKAIKILVAALVLCVMVFVPELQAKNDKTIAKINKAVGFTLAPGQAAQIDSILTAAQTQLQALPPSDRRAQGAVIRQASMKEVRKQLTPAQQIAFDAMH